LLIFRCLLHCCSKQRKTISHRDKSHGACG
jgi:hypothetical protein